MKRHFSILFTVLFIALHVCSQTYVTEIPDEDHMSYFALRGPVKEVRMYDYAQHGKTIWRFDKEGRLVHYENYGTPYAGDGGCVFRLTDRYRYAYDSDGRIIVLESYNEVETLVDENDDKILTLFPLRAPKDLLFEKATKEYGDTTYCYSRWWEQEGDAMQHYQGRRYDKYGNWIEDFTGTEDSYDHTDVRVREIDYYKDIELMDLPVGVKTVTHRWKADDKYWGNCYDFDKDGFLTHFHSWVAESEDAAKEPLYEWDIQTDDMPGSDLIPTELTKDTKREVSYWSPVALGELTVLPKEITKEEAFYLVFHYMGYVFEGDLYPLHNGWWVVMSRWCLDEMDSIYLGEDEDGNPIPAASVYKDPFGDKRYPLIKTDSISFSTRNYSHQAIKVYGSSEGKKVTEKLKVQCSLQVLDADVTTRRVLCRTSPNDWDWEENPQFYSIYGWMDEEWICSNLFTTCP